MLCVCFHFFLFISITQLYVLLFYSCYQILVNNTTVIHQTAVRYGIGLAQLLSLSNVTLGYVCQHAPGTVRHSDISANSIATNHGILYAAILKGSMVKPMSIDLAET